ncbi:MAG: hypothetical protein ACREGI_03980 [Candidatus Levyibacteriota bacterium]
MTRSKDAGDFPQPGSSPQYDATKDTLAELAGDLPRATPTGLGLSARQLVKASRDKLRETFRGRDVNWERVAQATLRSVDWRGPRDELDTTTILANVTYSGVSEESSREAERYFAALSNKWVGVLDRTIEKREDPDSGLLQRVPIYRLRPDTPFPQGTERSLNLADYSRALGRLRLIAQTGTLQMDFPGHGS